VSRTVDGIQEREFPMNVRNRALLIVPAALGIALGAGIAPASATPSQTPSPYHADCVGQQAVYFNQYGYGDGGRISSWLAMAYGGQPVCIIS